MGLYKEEMGLVLGLIYQVRNELGAGWSEEIYHQTLVYLIQEKGIPFRSKPRSALIHRDVEIHIFEPDLIVWGQIILELKVLLDYKGRSFPKANQAQLFHYLKFYEKPFGYLINFAHSKVGVQRMLFDSASVEREENYERMRPHVTENDKQILREVRRHIHLLAAQYGPGYPETIYRKLLAVELTYQGISCVDNLDIVAKFGQHTVGIQKTPCLLIENRFLLHVRSSLTDIPKYDFIKLRTYLNALDLKVGWVINFGHNTLQIHATVTK